MSRKEGGKTQKRHGFLMTGGGKVDLLEEEERYHCECHKAEALRG